MAKKIKTFVVIGILTLASFVLMYSYSEVVTEYFHAIPKAIISMEMKNNEVQKKLNVIHDDRINITHESDKSKPRQACVHPLVAVDDPIMMKAFKQLPKTVCPGQDWVYVDNGTLRFSPEAVELHKSISCDYFPVIRIDEWMNNFASPIKNISNPFTIKDDEFKIECTGRDGKKYENMHQAVPFRQSYVDRPQDPLKNGFEGMSIAILGFDSMSRMSWLRRMVKTREYFVNKLGAIELEQHNVLGDGTILVLFPMLMNKFERNLPGYTRGHKAKPMNDLPWIWHDFKKAGYLTAWNNAQPHGSPLNWKNSGFKDRPTDYYARAFYVSAFPRMRGWCLGSQARRDIWLNWFRDVFHMYKKQRKFLFHFLTDMSHDDNNLLNEMDEPMQNMVQHLHEDGYLNNTLLIMMGDHGVRYGGVRSTIVGKTEERQPYYSMLFPPWFQKKYPEAIRNLKINAKRLTTPFDIHATFKEFFNYTGTGMGSINDRGISLFKEVPKERTCKHAEILSHWCACLDWKVVSITDPGVQNAVKTALSTINGLTEKYRSDCAFLSISSVTMATKREYSKQFLTFSNRYQSSKEGNQASYQITFYTTPGNGLFEVTVTHDFKTNKFSTSDTEISRLNKYGDAPYCIVDKNRRIQPYCYCKDLIKS